MPVSIDDLKYSHPSLHIPPSCVEDLLPKPSLSMLEFLEFKLPIINSLKTLTSPSNFFSKVDANILETSLLCGITVSSNETLAEIGSACQKAIQDGAISVLCHHIYTSQEKCLPVWVVPYWTEVSSLRKHDCPHWAEAAECLQDHQQKRVG